MFYVEKRREKEKKGKKNQNRIFRLVKKGLVSKSAILELG
jgi:hypothetical protein